MKNDGFKDWDEEEDGKINVILKFDLHIQSIHQEKSKNSNHHCKFYDSGREYQKAVKKKK